MSAIQFFPSCLLLVLCSAVSSANCSFHLISLCFTVSSACLSLRLVTKVSRCVKLGSQYDARASVASQASGWRWNRLDFYSNVASQALASVQPISLLKNITSGMQFDWWKKDFSVTLTTLVTLAAPVSYCEPGFTTHYMRLARTYLGSDVVVVHP